MPTFSSLEEAFRDSSFQKETLSRIEAKVTKISVEILRIKQALPLNSEHLIQLKLAKNFFKTIIKQHPMTENLMEMFKRGQFAY